MKKLTRRDMVAGLASVAAISSANAQQQATAFAGTLGSARVLSPKGNVTRMPDGSDRWEVFAGGTLATGEAITLHESWVPAGTPSLPLHTIAHSQLIFVIEGTLEYLHDGVSDRAEPGSVIYVPFGTTDLVKNIGAGVARYFVMHIGGDTKKA